MAKIGEIADAFNDAVAGGETRFGPVDIAGWERDQVQTLVHRCHVHANVHDGALKLAVSPNVLQRLNYPDEDGLIDGSPFEASADEDSLWLVFEPAGGTTP